MSPAEYHVEIWFRITKDESGYPASKEWEQLLAAPVVERPDWFRIASVPFYLRDVSLGDLVQTKTVRHLELGKEEVFEFEKIIERGGHNTYRLLLRKKNENDPEFTTAELIGKGLAIEERDGDFFAVDVPPSLNQQMIDSFLVAEANAGRWEMQDGYLHSVNTTPPEFPR